MSLSWIFVALAVGPVLIGLAALVAWCCVRINRSKGPSAPAFLNNCGR